MKPTISFRTARLAVFAVVATVAAGCGPPSYTCEETYTCPQEPKADSGDGDTSEMGGAAGATIARAPIGGGAVTQLATNQSQPASIALDAPAAYWVTETGGTVARVAK